MNKIYFFFLLIPAFLFSQQKPEKLRFFTILEANIGFDVAAIIREKQVTSEYERQNLDPGKFNYGFAAQAGFQPINWFALGTGLRYSFVDPNFHVMYWNVQPYFFINNPKDEDFVFLSANYGTQINRTASKNAKFVGISAGFFEPISKHFGNKFQLNLEVQNFDGNGTFFIGFSYGITFFSNKNL